MILRNLVRKFDLVSKLGLRTSILIVTSLFNVLTLRYLLEIYSKESVGKYLVLVAVGQTITMIDLGIGFSTSYLIALENLSNLSRRFIFLGTRLLLVAGTVGLAAAILFGHFCIDLEFHKYSFTDYRNFLIVVSGALIANALGPVFHSLVVFRKVNTYFLLDGLRPTLILFGVVLAKYLGLPIITCFITWSIANIFPGVIAAIIEKLYLFKRHSNLKTAREDSAILLKFGLPYQLSTIGNLANNSLPALLISSILGPSTVVPFQLLMRGITLFRAALGAIWLTIWPELVSDHGLAFQLRKIRILDKRIFQLSTFFAILNYLFAPTLLRFLFGFHERLSTLTLIITSLMLIAYSVEIVPSAVANTFADQKRKSILILFSGMCNVVLSLGLIPRLGYVGSLIATLLTYCILYLFPLHRLYSNRIKYTRKLFWKS